MVPLFFAQVMHTREELLGQPRKQDRDCEAQRGTNAHSSNLRQQSSAKIGEETWKGYSPSLLTQIQSRLGEGSRKESPESGYERVPKVFWTQGANCLLHWSNIGLHQCKTGFGRWKRLLADPCSLGRKDLLHPLVTTFETFLFSAASRRWLGLQCKPRTKATA